MSYLRSKAIFMSIIIICAVFTIHLITPVEARQDACCEKTKSGEYCQYTALRDCDRNFNVAPTTCDQTQYCQLVCCVNSQEGVCYKNVPAAQCDSKGGEIDASSPACEINQCKLGCCNIGDQYFLSTDRACKLAAAKYPDIDKATVFDGSITNERQCVELGRQQDGGCCVDKDVCSFTAREQCKTDFYKDTFCSDSRLLCGCTPQAKKGCVEGEDAVYWFDSCGNKEGVAEDCDYEQGTLCQVRNKQAACHSIDCPTTVAIPDNPHDPKIGVGAARKHGESWCSYESGAGDFLDRVGSRHYRHVCVNGRELIQECRDFREEVCVQADMPNGLSVGNCLNNEIYDSKVTVNISTVPRGQPFWDGSNKDFCNQGTTKCPVIWAKKNTLDDWDCVANCHCEQQQHINDVAKYCKSQGDCGADLNILNKQTTDGLQISWVGTGKGPRPSAIDNWFWENRSIYGVYGGMLGLKQIMEAFTASNPDLPGTFETTTLGITAALVIVAAALTYVWAGLASFLYLLGPVSAGLAGIPVVGVIIVVILIIVAWLLGNGESEEKTVTATCDPWVAPIGSNDCGQCSDDPRYQESNYNNPVICSQYRCKSLGVACELVNEGTKDAKCVGKNMNDATSPVISSWPEVLSKGYTLNPLSRGYTIVPPVKPFERISFGIKTDEVAQCKFDTKITQTFDEMTAFFGTNIFATEFAVTLGLRGSQDYTYYIRCRDFNGNANVDPYVIKLSTSDEPDKTPPLITGTSIPNGAFIPHDVNETALTVYLNEPAEFCRWQKGPDADLDSMPEKNLFFCNSASNNTLFPEEYHCRGVLADIEPATENIYYLRCKDPSGNAMQEGYKYVLQGTTAFSITSLSPEGELYIASPVLQVTTAGGAENGKAVCTYQQRTFKPIPFVTTNTNVHAQPLKDLSLGQYTYAIVCTDAAGNKDSGTISFSVTVDTKPPKITNLYTDQTTLYLVTDELSTCAYSNANKQFSRDQGLFMSGENTKEHTTALAASVYYILCWDNEDNQLGPITVYT